MAGNIRADNNGNILVEFDYNNIIVVDPNKTIDDKGNIKERLVDHENLVMYANLEADVLPRTKLAVGGAPNNGIQTISVAKINFLKPTKNTYLSSGYLDQLTGENTTKFHGENQMFQKTVDPGDGTKPYVVDSPADLTNIMDNGLLGITQINIQTNSSFIPSVRIELEDVQGKALFELGNNSPYAAFFNLPYPQFYLTLKGYYGQAIRYQLNLEKFNARFNSFSGNYQISLEFKGYKFNILTEIAMGHLLALPHMYSQTYNVGETPVGPQQTNKSAEAQNKTQVGQVKNNASSTEALTVQVTSNKGYQKILEVYSEYKSKGLISPDFPELTLVQLMNKLQNFEKILQQSFDKADVVPLTNIRTYKEYLQEYFNTIRGNSNSWFNNYMDPAPVYLKNGEPVYTFKKLDQKVKNEAVEILKKDVKTYNEYLGKNTTLGDAGPSKIPNPIKYETIAYDKVTKDQIDWFATAAKQTGNPSPSTNQITDIINKVIGTLKLKEDEDGKPTIVPLQFFVFEGPTRFDSQLASMDSQATKKLQEYEAAISAKLLKKIEDKTKGLGFKPTVRNMMAVIMASAEGFIRLMDEVHTNAWSVKDDPIRKAAILNNNSAAPSPDAIDVVYRDPFSLFNDNTLDNNARNSEVPVYPWPQFFVESPNDRSRFELKYIGDPSVAELTQAFVTKSWPEVEFLEEYLKGLVKKFNLPDVPDTLENDKYSNVLNLNAIEFPSFGLAYMNKEELKFFYEIWERQFVTAHYSGLIRANENQINDLIKLNTETEVNNIYESININAPYLSFKLKNYDLTAQNYVQNLENFSNAGTGKSYQDFIRDFYVTPYLKGLVDNPTSILSILDLGQIPQTSTTSPALRQLLSVASNEKLIVDTIPFSNPNWCLNNMSDGATTQNGEVYNTKNTLTVFEPRKIIANFNDVYDYKVNRPVTNFAFMAYNNPYTEAYKLTSQPPNQLKPFYEIHKPNLFLPTEGTVESIAPSGNIPFSTTTSMLNTPYFVNAIQIGVDNVRASKKYPFIQAAYLFLNSLPLASLREKYKTLNDDSSVKELDYIASCFNKFGAIHKLPYPWILKLGSIWYRYKLYKEKGIDILTDVWKNFEYKVNYSPVLSSDTQTYSFIYCDGTTKIPSSVVLQKEETDLISINTGFYPKLINDFNVFYNGFELYTEYNDVAIQKSIDMGMKVYQFSESAIQAKQNDKTIRIGTWSVLIPDFIDTDVNCGPQNNTNGSVYYVIPSFGSQINQTQYDCIVPNTDITAVNLTNNDSMYNGSIRTLWSAPNYGYFDNNQVVMPRPDQYINYIDPKSKEQSPFKLLNKNNYSSIEEIFSVFEKNTLDKFEQEFLSFCKPITDADLTQPEAAYQTSTTNLNANFRNFQSLMRSVMAVPSQLNSQSNIVYFQSTIDSQNQNFQSEIKAFLQYDILFRNGNPSKYRRRIFDSYLSYLSTPYVTDPIPFEPYVPGTLPTKTGNILLSQSKIDNPKAWLALETEVGFSTIPGVEYSTTGSYITDFFVDNNIKFDAANVVILAPLIKMYATSKLENPNITAAQFKNQLRLYLDRETTFQNDLLNLVLTGIRTKLPSQQQGVQQLTPSAINGDQSKAELWDLFKAINDKWISGDDFKSKTIFEDMLFLDRASRNIGDTILIDIFDIQGMFNQDSLNQAMSVFTFLTSILFKNNFVVMNLPAYVNFYNIQEVDGTTIPISEGTLDFANSMWGSFLDVDYRKSSPKMVCFYAPRPSSYLALPKGNFRYRDDGFDLRRASDNPLIENQQNKKDWGISNKCVGFNVDIGIRNQNIFYSFSVSQENGLATSESINTTINISNNATGKNVATQNNSLYNLYKQRSYKATVTCLGNALIQPSMYFNLRHVPMFNGPYMILDVQHQIQPGNFQTTFTGVRQGYFDLPLIDKFLQSINQNLLTKLEEILKIKKDVPKIEGVTNVTKANQVVQKADNTPDTANSCVSNVDVATYRDYQNVPAKSTNMTESEFAAKLKSLIPNNESLQAIIYSITYVTSYVKDTNTNGSGSFKGFNYNFGGISLSTDWGQTAQYFLKQYCCVNVKSGRNDKGNSEPLVSFQDLDSYIKFMQARLEKRVPQILEQTLPQWYACNWPKENVSVEYYQTHKSTFDTLRISIEQALKSCLVNKIITPEEKKTLSDYAKEAAKKLKEPGVTPTPTPAALQPGQLCPPPSISSFSPLVGNKGTILQINGSHLDYVTKIKLIDKEITVKDNKDVTVLNSETIRLTVPQIGTGNVVVEGKIELISPYGNYLTTQLFKYDPAVNPAAVSSPGGYAGNNQSSNANAVSVNTNPQNTGPVTLLSKYETLTGGKITNKLTVNVNPDAGAWVIDKNVELNISVFDTITSNNNTTQRLNVQVTMKKDTFVNSNTFTITRDDITTILTTSEPFKTTPIKPTQIITAQFNVLANAEDKVKHPQPTVQSFNFNYSDGTTTTSPKTFAEQPLSITLVGESPDLQGNGWEYFNVKKPAGGYITFKFNAPTFNESNYGLKLFIDKDGYPVPGSGMVGGINTKYTYLGNVNSVGTFKISVEYYPYGFTSPSGGEVLKQTVFSPPFTL